MGRIERIENLLEITAAKIGAPQNETLSSNVSFSINKHCLDKEVLSEKIFAIGVSSHTWFGAEEPPDGRVVSFSSHLPRKTRDAVLALIERLGFARYNLFDNQMENTEKYVLIGSYGEGDRDVPHSAQ